MTKTISRARTGRKSPSLCACLKWVTGRLVFQLETDAADEKPLMLQVMAPWPARTSISERYIRDMEKKLPGAMEIQKPSGKKARLIIRVSNTAEMAYNIFGQCPCGNLLIERDEVRI